MKHSTNRFLTTHVGSLSRPDDLLAVNRTRSSSAPFDEGVYSGVLASAVTGVVQHQKEIGIDVVGDGEFGKPMSQTYDYGAWWNYAYERMDGFVAAENVPETERRRSNVADLGLGSFSERRDWQKFGDFYQDPESTSLTGSIARRPTRRPVCTGPISYTGQATLLADIDNLRAALDKTDMDEGFLCAVAPGSFARGEDQHYRTEEEFVYAVAEAMREEYKTIVDAGLILQIDDPAVPDNWDMINPEPPLEEFKKFCMVRVKALNHALTGLPQERVRYHICWGSWHGPHTTDIPLKDIVDVVLSVNAGAYSVEAGNVRHEHEWRVWQDVDLPDGKILIPGVVSHATNVVEHPQLVADRIARYAGIVGRENVIAGTDCGLGGRVHPQIAWAKLESLVEGAALATKQFWS